MGYEWRVVAYLLLQTVICIIGLAVVSISLYLPVLASSNWSLLFMHVSLLADRCVLWLNDTSYSKCPKCEYEVSSRSLFIGTRRYNVQPLCRLVTMHSVTDRLKDGQTTVSCQYPIILRAARAARNYVGLIVTVIVNWNSTAVETMASGHSGDGRIFLWLPWLVNQ